MRVWARRERPEQPGGRPIEVIAADLRRLGTRYQALHPHAPFAKVEAVRGAYDKGLGEGCAALGRPPLRGVPARGGELALGRGGVEDIVAGAGVRSPPAV